MLVENVIESANIVNGDFGSGPAPVWSDDLYFQESKTDLPKSPKTRLRLQAVERILIGRKYDLKNLPSIGYWRNAYDLKLPSGVLLYRFQIDFQVGNLTPPSLPSLRHVAKPAAEWQVLAGLTEHEWQNALQGARMLIEADVFMVSAKKQTWLRPTEKFMEVFGLTLADYDTVGRLRRSVQTGRPGLGKLAPKDVAISPEDQLAVDRWRTAGGCWK